jgi:hypothetical protein
MRNILQHPAAAAIGQTPDAHSENSDPQRPADTRHHWSDTIWRRSAIAPLASYHMEGVDRALQAMGALQHLLMRDNRGVIERESDPDTYFEGLTANDQQGLLLALDVIWRGATDTMQHLRDNENNCWRTRGER